MSFPTTAVKLRLIMQKKN